MKKKILAISIIVILAFSIFSGCSSSSLDQNSSKSTVSSMESKSDYDSSEIDTAYNENTGESGFSSSDIVKDITSNTSSNSSLAEKVIYTATVDVETRAFEDSIEKIYSMLGSYDVFIQNSYITGTNYNSQYYGYNSYRNAQFTIRVPKGNYEKMLDSMSSIGNVTYSQSDAQNITSQYTDVESRLTAYRTEETQLLAMLEKCETVEDMISVQSRLSEVRYEIENLTSTLKNWDTDIEYSTIYLNLNEVRELSVGSSQNKPYWEDVSDTLLSTLRSVGLFFKDFFKYLIAALPILIILGIVALIIILIIRGAVKKSRKKHAKLMASENPKFDSVSNFKSPPDDSK